MSSATVGACSIEAKLMSSTSSVENYRWSRSVTRVAGSSRLGAGTESPRLVEVRRFSLWSKSHTFGPLSALSFPSSFVYIFDSPALFRLPRSLQMLSSALFSLVVLAMTSAAQLHHHRAPKSHIASKRGSCQAMYSQCGGLNFDGPTCCEYRLRNRKEV